MRNNRTGKRYGTICSILIILLLAGCEGNGTSPRNTGESPKAADQSSTSVTEGTTSSQADVSASQAAVSPSQTDGNPSSKASSQGITEADARQIALNHAGVSESDAIYIQVKPERDHGRDEYDVEFYAGNKEYDYEIDAVTGEILSYDYDAESYNPPASQNQDASSFITQEQAKDAALAHANVSEEEISKLKIEFDQEHGKAEYDIEFDVGQTEYEYEIDAVTGDIISFESDRD